MEGKAQIIAQLWQLAEGQCGEEQARRLRALIDQDEAVNIAWREIDATHRSLNALLPEQPSLRFQQNILDRLPKQKEAEDLIPRWGRWLLASSFAAAFLLTMLGMNYASSPSYDLRVSALERIQITLQAWLVSFQWPVLNWTVSSPSLLYVALAGVGISLLLALDRAVQKQRTPDA